jgi:MATE family multidrug resistance protein
MHKEHPEVTVGQLLVIAFPMIISQASETIMLFLNRYFVSFLGPEYIPASMSGGLTQFVFTSLFAGTVGYVNALTAQYQGAGRPERAVRVVAQGFWLSLAFFPVLLALIPLVQNGFAWAGHDPRLVALEVPFFRILMGGSILFLLQSVLVGYFVGRGKTRVVMIASVLGIFVNVPLNWMFVFGRLGMPRMGIEGAAVGTLCGTLFIVAVLFVAFLRSAAAQRQRGWDAWKPRRDIAVKLLRFGAPAGVEIFVNVFAFNLFILLMQSYGPSVAASVTITFNYDLVAFIPMLGVGAAVTALAGQRMGAGDITGARRAAFLGLRLAWSYAGVMVVVFLAGAPFLVRLFLHGAPGTDIVPLATTMLRLAAIYTLADATQVVFAGALRGAGDTKYVMIISGVLHWVMASTAFLFIRVFVLPPVAVWVFFITFVISLGAAMFLRHRGGAWQRMRLVEEAPLPELYSSSGAPPA